MVGFCLNALGQWQEKQTAYDGGAAVIPEYRGRGVAKEMFAFLMPRLKEAGVSQYLLEVRVEHPAATLYRKLGFVETRRLAMFDQSHKNAQEHKRIRRQHQTCETPGLAIISNVLGWISIVAEFDRSRRKGHREPHNQCLRMNNECVSYGVVFVPSANLMQQPSRHSTAGKESAQRFSRHSGSQNLSRSTTSTKNSNPLAFYEANGYKQVLEQFEMIKTL